MNRIRELREARGLTQQQLADACGTTQPTIDRLEKGIRQLTEKWMQRLASALQVEPADLLATALTAGLSEDAAPYVPRDTAISSAALAQRGLAHFLVKSPVVELAGVPAGTVILIDMTPDAAKNLKTGDIVVAQVYDNDDALKATTIVRQFVAPALLTTNRHGTNTAFNMADAPFDVSIKGVRIPG